MESKGFIAISTVLILSVVVVSIVSTVTLLAIGEGQSALALGKGEETLLFVEGCVEDGLLKSANSPSFGEPIGTPVYITRPDGTCAVIINSKTGIIWDMTVTTIAVLYKRTVRVNFSRNTTGITLNSWVEI